MFRQRFARGERHTQHLHRSGMSKGKEIGESSGRVVVLVAGVDAKDSLKGTIQVLEKLQPLRKQEFRRREDCIREPVFHPSG